MEIIGNIKELSVRLKISENDFPIFYQNPNVSFFVSSNSVVIPYSVYKSYFLKNCKIEFYPLRNNERLTEAEEKVVLNDFVHFVKEKKLADKIVPSNNYVVFNAFPDSAVNCGFGTYQIRLDITVEQLWANMHSKHRNVIRNAEKNNVVLRYGIDQIENFYLLYNQTMKRSSMYCEEVKQFRDIFERSPNNTICGVAYYDNIPQGAIFIPYSKYGAFYIYGASAEKVSITGAINYLHWNTIKLLKAENVKLYDFVGARLSDVSGTKLEGIQKFKERFGSDLIKGYMWKVVINIARCNAYDFLLRVKLKVKGVDLPKDIIDQEIEKQQA